LPLPQGHGLLREEGAVKELLAGSGLILAMNW